jgi:hypothetical protein
MFQVDEEQDGVSVAVEAASPVLSPSTHYPGCSDSRSYSPTEAVRSRLRLPSLQAGTL